MLPRTRAVAAALLAALAAAVPAGAAGRCGEHPWCDTALQADVRADLLLGAMTQEEKVGLIAGDDKTGVDGGDHTHTGTQLGIPRLDVPTVLYSDGPAGPRQGHSTALPIPLALAATFDPGLAVEHGRVAALEARAKGNDVIYGPAVNIARTPLSGRTFENYGEDPFLTSRMAVGWIRGAQGTGVIADVKHFAANNQEGLDPAGPPVAPGADGSRVLIDALVDERTLREIYLPHFEAAVREGFVGTVMCAYNRLDGPYSCENPGLLQQVLRREWGFEGYVLADYGAAHDTLGALNAGLDFEPYGPLVYDPARVDAVLADGTASLATLDAHVRAILLTWFRFGLFDRAAYVDDDAQIDKAADARVARSVAEQAVTLLKNGDRTHRAPLPLHPRRGSSIAVIGPAATTFTTGGGSAAVVPFAFAAPLDAIRARAGTGVRVGYASGNDVATAVRLARRADVALVFANDFSTEGVDRACLSLECPPVHGDQDALIRAVAAANPRTVVVLASGGPDLTPWRGRVAGVVEAWFGGGQAGPALARVLFGDTDPGGRLPITFPNSEAQLPTAVSPDRYPGRDYEARYDEGVLIGYRWFDHEGLAPAFPFGFGLSYTRTRFSGLRVTATEVSARVTNTGTRRGYAVPQLYVGLPQPSPGVVQPPVQLKGIAKLSLAPGASRRVSFPLDARALSYWDVTAHAWRIAPGCVQIRVGRSSRDLPLRGALAVRGGSCRP